MATKTTTELQSYSEAETAVLQNPLILDKILEFVLFKRADKGELITGSDAANVRLVAKNWLQSASRAIKLLKQPVLNINLGSIDKTNKINGETVEKSSQKIMDDLVSVFGYTTCHEDSTLSLFLRLKERFFHDEKLPLLLKFLDQCGKHLFGLQMFVSVDVGIMPLNLEKWDFPMLQKLDVTMIRNSFELLQLILNGAKNLKKFNYMLFKHCGETIRFMESIKLSPQITHIKSVSGEFVVNYSLLINNDLPKLRELRFNVFSAPSDEQIFEVLDRFKNSLQLLEFKLEGLQFPNSKSFLRFPVMKETETILIHGQNFELDSNTPGGVSKKLPKLRKLMIGEQTESSWNKWFKNSTFKNVRELFVLLRENHNDDHEEDYYHLKSISFGFMYRLKTSFPNVTNLHLNLLLENVVILKTLFREWRQLEELELIFHGNLILEVNTNLLAYGFLGISPEKVEELSNMLDNSKEGSSILGLECNSEDSIISLTQLTALTLRTNRIPCFLPWTFNNFKTLLRSVTAKLPGLNKLKFLDDFQWGEVKEY